MKKKYKVLIIILGSILLLLCVGITYSFFHSSAISSNADQNIAKFVFNAKSQDQIQLPLINLNPGDNQEYTFSVSNNNSESISDITVEYRLTIKTYHLVPLNIKLYKIIDDNPELVLTCDETYTRNDNNEIVCNSPTQEMGYNSEKLENYRLDVTFPEEYNDSTYSDLVDYINIEIKSWQKLED